MKSWLIGKDPDAGKDWGQEKKGTTEDETAGWHHRLDRRESEWTLGVGDGQGGLACCDSWGRKGSDTTERLNWTELRVHKVRLVNNEWMKIPWRKEWLPTPVLLPGEFHGQRSLVGYNTWSRKELDTIEQLTLFTTPIIACRGGRVLLFPLGRGLVVLFLRLSPSLSIHRYRF